MIDIWREVNKIIARSRQERVSFDAFYIALQKFKLGHEVAFEKAASDVISFLERKPDTVLEEREQGRRAPDRCHVRTGQLLCRTGRRASKSREVGGVARGRIGKG